MKKVLKSKKSLVLIGVVLIVIISLILFLIKDKDGLSTFDKISGDKINIKYTEVKTLEYETYNNGLISIKIPKGWKVDTLGDYIHYTFRAYNPNNTDYQIFYNFKSEGYFKSQAAKNWQIKYYGKDSYLGQMPVLAKHTTEGFYNIFNTVGALNNTTNFKFPTIDNFEIIQNFGKTMYGGDLLRATYSSNNNREVQGLFTASVYSTGTYYVNTDVFNFNSSKVDMATLSVYNTIFLTAPKDEFITWQKVLDECFGTLEFSDKFVQGFYSQEDALLKTIKANSKIYNEISDSIMSSWEKRNTSYDIISQKQSDATLGYRRVYDTETGEIYKAYNAFLDDYKGTRYKEITDDMYTKSIDGYIEK